MGYQNPIDIMSIGYQSPINIITNKIKAKIEDEILTAVQKVGVDVDKDELLKALAYDRDQYQKGYNDRDREIVRCKDCLHMPHLHPYEHGCDIVFPDEVCPCRNDDSFYSWCPDDDWFCPRGER